jgi:hypothetical protein
MRKRLIGFAEKNYVLLPLLIAALQEIFENVIKFLFIEICSWQKFSKMPLDS